MPFNTAQKNNQISPEEPPAKLACLAEDDVLTAFYRPYYPAGKVHHGTPRKNLQRQEIGEYSGRPRKLITKIQELENPVSQEKSDELIEKFREYERLQKQRENLEKEIRQLSDTKTKKDLQIQHAGQCNFELVQLFCGIIDALKQGCLLSAMINFNHVDSLIKRGDFVSAYGEVGVVSYIQASLEQLDPLLATRASIAARANREMGSVISADAMYPQEAQDMMSIDNTMGIDELAAGCFSLGLECFKLEGSLMDLGVENIVLDSQLSAVVAECKFLVNSFCKIIIAFNRNDLAAAKTAFNDFEDNISLKFLKELNSLKIVESIKNALSKEKLSSSFRKLETLEPLGPGLASFFKASSDIRKVKLMQSSVSCADEARPKIPSA